MEKRIKASDRVGTTVKGFVIFDWKREGRRTYFYAECPYCKNKVWIRADSIIGPGTTVSCGCYNKNNNYKKPIDISERKFGRLKAIEPTDEREDNGKIIWKCECECGNITYVSVSDLTRKRVRSCGCLQAETRRDNCKIAGNNIKNNYCIDDTNVNRLTAKISKRNTSGIKGVSWDKSRNRWVAQIEFKKKHYHLGRFENLEDAAQARKNAEDALFGNFLQWYNENHPQNTKEEEKPGEP